MRKRCVSIRASFRCRHAGYSNVLAFCGNLQHDLRCPNDFNGKNSDKPKCASVTGDLAARKLLTNLSELPEASYTFVTILPASFINSDSRVAKSCSFGMRTASIGAISMLFRTSCSRDQWSKSLNILASRLDWDILVGRRGRKRQRCAVCNWKFLSGGLKKVHGRSSRATFTAVHRSPGVRGTSNLLVDAGRSSFVSINSIANGNAFLQGDFQSIWTAPSYQIGCQK